jgi:tetratricopeptide (TPR) repeat protein
MLNDRKFNENNIPNSMDFGNDENGLLFLANKNYREKKFTEALYYLTKLTSINPYKAEYFSGKAIIQKNIGDYKEAEINYKLALEINPELYEGYYNLGILSYEQGNIDDAITYFWKAIEVKPDLYLAYYNLGNAFKEQNELNLSVDCYKKAIGIKSNFDDAHYNLGVVFEKKRELSKAIECYNNAIGCNSKNLNANWNLALLYLQTGDFSKGWVMFEVRKDRTKSCKRIFSKTELTVEPVNGKRILVYSEQGLGDTIQFARYLKLLKDRNAYVIFECKPRLLELFKDFDGIDKLIYWHNYDEKNIEYDYYISLLSLPLYFNTTLGSIPARIPYLTANKDKVNEWKSKIKYDKYLNIGIAWSGAKANITGKERSCELSDFSPLFYISGIKLFSLQKNETIRKINYSDFPVMCFDNIDSIPFLDTAAIIENLDLVISIDTSIAHLAGALGKPVWTLLPYYSDWRWLLNKDNSPWYPAMKLFRQPKPGGWSKVFSTVADELNKILILRNQKLGLI